MRSHRRSRLCSLNCTRTSIRNSFLICIPPRSAHHSRPTIFRPCHLTCWTSRINTWKTLPPGWMYRPLRKTLFLTCSRSLIYVSSSHARLSGSRISGHFKPLLCIASIPALIHLYDIIALVFLCCLCTFFFFITVSHHSRLFVRPHFHLSRTLHNSGFHRTVHSFHVAHTHRIQSNMQPTTYHTRCPRVCVHQLPVGGELMVCENTLQYVRGERRP